MRPMSYSLAELAVLLYLAKQFLPTLHIEVKELLLLIYFGLYSRFCAGKLMQR